MNYLAMMRQAKEMQGRLQKEMTELRVEATAGGGMVTVDRTAPSRNYKFSEVAGRLGAGLAVPLSDSSVEFFVEGSKWFYGRVSTGEGTQFDTSVSVGLTFVPDL